LDRRSTLWWSGVRGGFQNWIVDPMTFLPFLKEAIVVTLEPTFPRRAATR
jgi:hypothetical protein